jgi:hypothetical protein
MTPKSNGRASSDSLHKINDFSVTKANGLSLARDVVLESTDS